MDSRRPAWRGPAYRRSRSGSVAGPESTPTRSAPHGTSAFDLLSLDQPTIGRAPHSDSPAPSRPAQGRYPSRECRIALAGVLTLEVLTSFEHILRRASPGLRRDALISQRLSCHSDAVTPSSTRRSPAEGRPLGITPGSLAGIQPAALPVKYGSATPKSSAPVPPSPPPPADYLPRTTRTTTRTTTQHQQTPGPGDPQRPVEPRAAAVSHRLAQGI